METFRANVVRWLASRDGGPPGTLGDRLEVQRVVPVRGGPLPLFAVRVSVMPPDGVQGVPSVGAMLVDAGGRYRFGGVTILGTGTEIARVALDEAMRYDLPRDFGRELADFGGGHEVVVVSDPFCGHCRKLWKTLVALRGAIGEFRMVHLPLVGREGAEALGWAMEYAGGRGLDVLAMTDFVMGEMEQPGGGLFTGRDAAEGALEALFGRFPELERLLGPPGAALETLRDGHSTANGRDRERAWRYGLGSVPCVFVDGLLLRGFNPSRLRSLLED